MRDSLFGGGPAVPSINELVTALAERIYIKKALALAPLMDKEGDKMRIAEEAFGSAVAFYKAKKKLFKSRAFTDVLYSDEL